VIAQFYSDFTALRRSGAGQFPPALGEQAGTEHRPYWVTPPHPHHLGGSGKMGGRWKTHL